EDIQYEYDVDATDGDGDSLVYTLTQNPTGMSIDAATGIITWTPVQSDVGTNQVIVKVVDETGESATQNYNVTVSNVNDVPVITSTPVTIATVDVLYQYDVTATDGDADSLVYSLTQNPTGMSINTSTGIILWTPVQSDVGTHPVSVSVNDGNAGSTNQNYSVTVFNNFFPNYYAVDVGSWPETVAIGDLNNDGKNDVVLGTGFYVDPANDHSLFIFLQDNSGNLNTPIKINLTNPSHQSINSIKSGDMNGDGLDDIICGNYDRIEIFLQTDVGITTSSYSLTTDNSRWITIGDYNNDGLKDVAGISWSSNEVDVFLQQSDGLLVFSETLSVEYGGYNDIETGDVNNDGLDDIVVMSGQSNISNIGILTQSINGGFNEAVYYDNERDPWGLSNGVAVGDINNDALSDVVISYGGNAPNSWIGSFLQNQDTNLLNPVIENSSYGIPESTEISDINSDGLNDIIVLHGGSRVGVYFQNDDGTLSSEQPYTIPYASSYNPHGLAIGDINSDGSNDIVIANYSHGLVVLNNAFETPIADAGSYPTFNVDSDCQALVTLDGSGSSDPNGDMLTYVWSGPFPEGGGTVTGSSPTVTMPKGYSTITLTVDDGNGSIASDSAIIIVIDNTPPVLSCLADITISNDPGVYGAVVTYTSPVGTDNCPGATTSQ
ncbi:MAG: hypothetical protein GY808_06355, partial [Gammaproteobacteria bacterium]|nr:hypothetical protein [Gammaproteobacteria bacterium]